MSMKNKDKLTMVKGLALHFPAKELLPKQGISSLAPVSPPQWSSLSPTPKKPNTYQGCRARKRLCMLSFINIIIQGQKEESWGWLVALVANDVGQTLALTVRRWAPTGGVGKGGQECGTAGSSQHGDSSESLSFHLCLISPTSGLPPLLNFFLSSTSSVSDAGFVQCYFSMTSESTTCFVFVCSIPEAPILSWASVTVYSCIISCIFFYKNHTISWILIICHPQLWRQDMTSEGPLTWYGMFPYTYMHM